LQVNLDADVPSYVQYYEAHLSVFFLDLVMFRINIYIFKNCMSNLLNVCH